MNRRLALGAVLLAFACLLPARPTNDAAVALSAIRRTLVVGISASIAGACAGAAWAIFGALLGRRAEDALVRLTEMAGSLPSVLVVPLALVTPGGDAGARFFVAIAVLRAAEAAHLVRARTRELAGEDFVRGAVALGASRVHLAIRHIGPFVLPAIAASITSGAASAVALDVGAGYLGLAPGNGLGSYVAERIASGAIFPAVLAGVASAAAVLPLLAIEDRLAGSP